MSVRFDTSTFENSHGRKPKGHGGWIFSPVRSCDSATLVSAPADLSFTEAKSWIKTNHPGVSVWYVCP